MPRIRPPLPSRDAVASLVGIILATTAHAVTLEKTSIELPAAPAAIVSTDIDRDGVRDLAVVVVWTDWGELTSSRETETEVGLAEVLTVVPALLERRELRLFLGTDGLGTGGVGAGDRYRPAAEPLPLGRDVLTLGAGPPAVPLWALTDDGFAAVELRDGALSLVSLTDEPPVHAGSGAFVGGLELAHDLDGAAADDPDGGVELLLPADDALVVYALDRSEDGPSAIEIDRVALPTDVHLARRAGQLRRYPLPEVRDVDGDRIPDLLFPSEDARWAEVTVLRGRGGGRFAESLGPLELAPRAPADDDNALEAVWLGDLGGEAPRGGSRAELVRRQFLGDGDAGMREGLRQAKRPPFRYFLHRLDSGLRPVAEPYARFDASGYAFETGGGGGDDDTIAPSIGLLDLDGDGDRDLVTLTLDFSMFQAVRVLTTKSLRIGLDFHVHCQEDGVFRPVEGLDLSGTFRLDLRDVRVGRLAQFRGDFDGDGRLDFLQMGRGRELSIHRGREGCRYPAKPDVTLTLDEEPRDLALVRVEDYDADGCDDVLLVQPMERSQPVERSDSVRDGVTPPVRLDLYRSARSRAGS